MSSALPGGSRRARAHAAWLRAAALGLAASLVPAAAASTHEASKRLLAVGVMAHDRGFASDHHEDGVDLNLEIQFAPRAWFGSPRPHLGVTLNFNGDTSMAYAGLGFRLRETARWFADVHVSAAAHDGPLHKDPVGCETRSDCGYGVRVMPRLGVEIAYRIRSGASVSVLYDHMSHKWIIGGENEGLDHIGLRWQQRF